MLSSEEVHNAREEFLSNAYKWLIRSPNESRLLPSYLTEADIQLMALNMATAIKSTISSKSLK